MSDLSDRAVFFTEAGPIPAWVFRAVRAAFNQPCDCDVPDVAQQGHGPSCARGEAFAELHRRIAEERDRDVKDSLT